MRFSLGALLVLSSIGLSESGVCQICSCSFCPKNWKISNPKAEMVIPEEFKPLLPASVASAGTASCELIDVAGTAGLIPDQYCNDELRLRTDFRQICGCPSVEGLVTKATETMNAPVSKAPTSKSPTKAPKVETPIPTAALVFDKTETPTAGPVAATVSIGTAASSSNANATIIADDTDPPTVRPTAPPATAPPTVATGATEPPTVGPVAAPSTSPVVATTGSPVVATTGAPSKAPVVATTGTPVAATGTPTKAPVVASTSTPVAAATGTPTTAPVVASTGAPVVATTASPSKAPVAATTAPVATASSDTPSATPSDIPSKAPVAAAITVTSPPTGPPTTGAPTDAPSDAPSDVPSQSPVPIAEATIFARLENVTTTFAAADELSFSTTTENFLTEAIDSAENVDVSVLSSTSVTRRRSRRLENGNVELSVLVKAATLASDECFEEIVLDVLDTGAYFDEVHTAFTDLSGLNVAADADVPASKGKGKKGKGKSGKGKKGKKGKGACKKGKGSKGGKSSGKSGSGKSGKGVRNLTEKEEPHTRNVRA